MAVVAPAHLLAGPAHAPQLTRALERLRGALLWLTAFSGAFVFMEPSPYEICSLLTIIVFVLTGLTLRVALMPLIAMLLLYSVGFGLAVIQISNESKPVIWIFVSWYLAITAIFFAAMLGTNTQERLTLLMKGYMMAAAVASLIGILAYFRVLGRFSDTFLLYDRARGTFNDPNVLGAFLVLPGVLALQQMMAGRIAMALRGGLFLAIIAAAILLSFSRAAWGQFAFAAALAMFFTFVTSRSPRERLRIVLITLAGMVVLALFVAALLSIDRVAELFKARASLEQSYDVGHLGRFGRYILGAILALDHPFGIGPMQFSKIFGEDPHNTYLNSFMSGGWLAGFVYLALVLVTLVMGLRFVFVATPWRATYIAVYCTFVGTAIESAIIDSDHWRHYWLLLGVLWGLMAVGRGYAGRDAPAPYRPGLARALRPA